MIFQWMFQRYEIVIDYEQRLRLPPPLTILSYVIMSVKWLKNNFLKYCKQQKHVIVKMK